MRVRCLHGCHLELTNRLSAPPAPERCRRQPFTPIESRYAKARTAPNTRSSARSEACAPDSRGRPAYLTQQGDVFFVDGGFRGCRARRWLALGLGQVEAEPIDPRGRAPTRRGT